MLNKFSHLTVSVTRHSTFAGCDGQINESQLILDRLKLLFVPTVVSVINDLAVPAVLHFFRPLTVQESPAIADKPARRESMPKIAPIRRAYNVVADNTCISSFV